MSVSVIIPTFNRFKYLLNAIESVRNQTKKPEQIIVVNDGSTQSEYYTHDFGNDITLIHLSKNSKEILGQKSPGGIQRNIGLQIATGEYIAFLDDDDYWLPTKLEKQIKKMKETNIDFSTTEGLFGNGPYDKNKTYKKYLTEHTINELRKIFFLKGWLLQDFPQIWNKTLFYIHNCALASAVVVKKDLILSVGGFKLISFADDYECWLRIIEKTDCLFLDEPLVYIDGNHGDGRQYETHF